MNILMAGSSGMIGTAVRGLVTGRHNVLRLRRPESSGFEGPVWDPAAGRAPGDDPAAQVVVNLAGEPLVKGRWTARRREAIRASRAQGTRLLAEWCARHAEQVVTMVSMSAIGYYGDRGEELLAEESGRGAGFLADVCEEWEQACQPALDAGVRVVTLRVGVVLSEKGGALEGMLGPFRMGMGGWLGSGDQWVSWVSLQDAARAIVHALDGGTAPRSGGGGLEVYNVVAPNPVRNREFAEQLGEVLNRPVVIGVPAAVARMMAGDMIDEMGLASQRVSPEKIESAGFRFLDTELQKFLEAELAS